MFKFPNCPLPKGSRVWGYLRDSGGDAQDLSAQDAYLLGYCDHHNLVLERVFRDAAVSGKSTSKRDEFSEMIWLARHSDKPKVDGILYWDIKRFARSQSDYHFYAGDLERLGYKLVSLSDEIPDTTFSPVIKAFLAWKAEQDLVDLRKDVKRGMEYLVGLKDATGKYLGIFPGAPPTFFKGKPYDTGLVNNDGKPRIVQRLVPDPTLWPLGQRMWQMRAERASYREIEGELGLFPNSKTPGSTYSYIFRNEFYIGRLHRGGQTYNDFVPALATPKQWDAVQQLNYKRGRIFKGTAKKHPNQGRGQFLLSGLCECLYCQAVVHASVNRRKERSTEWPYYICSRKKQPGCVGKRVAGRKLDAAVIEAVCSKILTVDFIEDLVDEVNTLLSDGGQHQMKLEQTQKRLSEVNLAINNLLKQAEFSPSQTIADRLVERETEKQRLEADLNTLKTQAASQVITIDRSVINYLLTKKTDTLQHGQLQAQKVVLREAVQKVELGWDVAKIYYTFPLSGLWLERVRGLEPLTSTLGRLRSTTELYPRI